MKEYIVRMGKECLDRYCMEWAQNYYAKEFQSQFDTPEAKKQIAAAEQNMLEIQTKIDFAKDFIKKNK